MKDLNHILEKVLFTLIVFFPLAFFLRSLILNFIILLISLIFVIVSINKNYNFLKFNYNKVLLIFFSFPFISQLFINMEIEKLIKSFFLLKFFLLFNATIYVFSHINKNYLKKLLNILIVLIILFILDLYLQYILGYNSLGFKPSFCEERTLKCFRYSGLFGAELVAGGFISIIVSSIFILTIILYKNKFLTIFPLILLITVYITGERTALVVMLAFSIIYYFKFFKFRVSYIVISVLIIGSFLSFAKESSKQRFINDTINLVKNDNNLSLIDSIKTTPWGLHYGASILMVQKKPIFGNGYKSFRVNCKNYDYLNIRVKQRHSVCSSHPHNFHLEILVDTGLIGYLLYLISIFFIFINYFSIKRIKEDKIMFIVFFFLLTIVFLPRPTGSIFSTFFGSMIWYFIGSMLGYVKLKSRF